LYKIITFFTILFFLISGCSVHKNRYNEKRNELESSITNTQKARLILDDDSAVLVTATYLNNLEKFEKNEVDTILLSIYFSNSEKDRGDSWLPKVSINSEEASIIKLSQDDEIINYLPSANAWSNHYLVTGKKSVDLKKFRFTVEIYPSIQALLTLQKDF